MDEWRWAFSPILIPIVAIIGGFVVAIVNSVQRARIRELEIRERIAMIEKGLMPPPEVDPPGFDRAMHRVEHFQRRLDGIQRYQWRTSASRHRRAGIVLIGVGVGLMVLIGFSGSPDEALGVGGFIAILGLAFLINSLFERSQPLPPPSASAP